MCSVIVHLYMNRLQYSRPPDVSKATCHNRRSRSRGLRPGFSCVDIKDLCRAVVHINAVFDRSRMLLTIHRSLYLSVPADMIGKILISSSDSPYFSISSSRLFDKYSSNMLGRGTNRYFCGVLSVSFSVVS